MDQLIGRCQLLEFQRVITNTISLIILYAHKIFDFTFLTLIFLIDFIENIFFFVYLIYGLKVSIDFTSFFFNVFLFFFRFTLSHGQRCLYLTHTIQIIMFIIFFFFVSCSLMQCNVGQRQSSLFLLQFLLQFTILIISIFQSLDCFVITITIYELRLI